LQWQGRVAIFSAQSLLTKAICAQKVTMLALGKAFQIAHSFIELDNHLHGFAMMLLAIGELLLRVKYLLVEVGAMAPP